MQHFEAFQHTYQLKEFESHLLWAARSYRPFLQRRLDPPARYESPYDSATGPTVELDQNFDHEMPSVSCFHRFSSSHCRCFNRAHKMGRISVSLGHYDRPKRRLGRKFH